MMLPARIACFDSGSVTRVNVRNGLAPRSREASRTDVSIRLDAALVKL